MKKAFTLIELMVVVVIIGVLAAVAIPKLFGMIARTKASEIGPAAKTYIKLQDAYIAESGAVGNWSKIGYSLNSSSNFSFSDPDNSKYVQNTINVDNVNELSSWMASSQARMNDCPIHSQWILTLNPSENSGSMESMIKYTPQIVSGDTESCLALFQNFNTIGN